MQTVTGNAACAIAARNAVFKVIPFAMVKPIITIAKQTAIGDIKTLAERRTRTLEKLAALGVNEKRACQAVGKAGVEEIGLDELATLFGLFNAVKEEEQTVEEAFPEIKKPLKFGEPDPSQQTTPIPTAPEPEEKKKPAKKDKAPPPERAMPIETLKALMTASGVEEPQLLTHLFSAMIVQQGETLDKLTTETIQEIIARWIEIAEAIKAEK